MRVAVVSLTLIVATTLLTISIRIHGLPTFVTSIFNDVPSSIRDTRPDVPFAFATFLANNKPRKVGVAYYNVTDEEEEARLEAEEDLDEDGYFVGVRHLAYSLLHNPGTRTDRNIPFVVLTTPDVSERKRSRLAADGADVVVRDIIPLAQWMEPGSERWKTVATKLQLFTMTQYRKICFIDADHFVAGNLDGVFEDPGTDLIQTLAVPEGSREDEAQFPISYIFAGKSDAFGYDHAIPPEASDYLNAGFYVFKPDEDLFRYYMSVLRIPNRFPSQFPEQNLFNYAHRRDGNMPWSKLDWHWNMNWPTVSDFEAGVRSFHAKYWDDDPTHDTTLQKMWKDREREMKAYFRGVDEGHRHVTRSPADVAY